jgi:deoxyribodipyrimidine photolyase-related protein
MPITQAILLFPHQLYDNFYNIENTLVVMVEDPLYFGTDEKYPLLFHKQKLVLHRASMKYYFAQIASKNKLYVSCVASENIQNITSRTKDILLYLKTIGITHITLACPTDTILMSRIQKYIDEYDMGLTILESPNFITPQLLVEAFFKDKAHFSMAEFYIWQRKRLNILMQDSKPSGGKWSYDSENRKKLPKDLQIPAKLTHSNPFVQEAKDWVITYFARNYGQCDNFDYPTTSKESKQELTYFLNNKLSNFGPYEDAIFEGNDSQLFHSNLSSSLNIGLLNPSEVVSRTILYAKEHEIPLASLEGFLRQIIGWREFMRASYILKGTTMRNSNILDHHLNLNATWYVGNTQIEPVDGIIKKLLKTAYAHHIERLMVIGNIMLLLQIEPTQVYKWFMEMHIDSYDWVMVPNVYAMSQYANSTLTTKPYISGSAYILKMSNHKKDIWCNVWDSLYWNFIEKHINAIESNPRSSMMAFMYKKFAQEKKDAIKNLASEWQKALTTT